MLQARAPELLLQTIQRFPNQSPTVGQTTLIRARALVNQGSAKARNGDLPGAIARLYSGSQAQTRFSQSLWSDDHRLYPAIQLQPDYALAYYNRGLAHPDLGNKQAAIRDHHKTAALYQQQGKTAYYQDAPRPLCPL